MFSVVLAALVYLLDQSLLDIFFEELDVKLLVLSVKVLQQLSLVLDVSVDSQEGWDLFRHDMDQVFTRQILQKYMASFDSMFRKIVQDTPFLLNAYFVVAIVVTVHESCVVILLLLLHELVHVILAVSIYSIKIYVSTWKYSLTA